MNWLLSLFRSRPSPELIDMRIQCATLTQRNEDLRNEVDALRAELLDERTARMNEIKSFSNWFSGRPVFQDVPHPQPSDEPPAEPIMHPTRAERLRQARREFDRDMQTHEPSLGLNHPIVRAANARHEAEKREALLSQPEAPQPDPSVQEVA